MMAEDAGNYGYEFSDEFRDTETGNESASDFTEVSRWKERRRLMAACRIIEESRRIGKSQGGEISLNPEVFSVFAAVNLVGA
jgi:hypothetical protein